VSVANPPTLARVPAARRPPPSGLRHTVGIMGHYIAQNLKVKLTYRTELAISLFSTVLWSVVNLTFFVLVFGEVPSMSGWSFEEIVFLYGFGQFTFGLFSCLLFTLMWDFGNVYLVEGLLDRVLLRPFPPLLQMVLEQFYPFDMAIIVKGAGIAAWAATKLGIAFTAATLAKFVVLGISAAMVLAGIALITTFASFWWLNRYGLFRPLFTFMEYSRYPLRVFPRWIQWLMTFVLPFGFACFYPASAFLGERGLDGFALATPVVGVGLLYLANRMLDAGIRRYESTGS
jgi:ABC-2 type transport system permease protein